jgi:hypothetical protein
MYVPPSLVQRGNGNQRIAGNKAQADFARGGFSDDSGNPFGCGEWAQPQIVLALHESTVPRAWKAGDRDGLHGSVRWEMP